MALIDCPECKQPVSDRATACPHCGYPVQEALKPDLAAILCAGSWQAHSATLVDALLDATFAADGTFQGRTETDPNHPGPLVMVEPAQFEGKWQVTASQLFIDFPLTMQGFAAPTQIAIQLNEVSDSKLRGIDAYLRSWEWEKT